jgi:hypothetical protein
MVATYFGFGSAITEFMDSLAAGDSDFSFFHDHSNLELQHGTTHRESDRQHFDTVVCRNRLVGK